MNNVISAEQARKITGGRTPLVPVEYETAVKALQACQTIDEAKYWSSKADALEAWARIHKDDKAGKEARSLRLFAWRRMGELAAEVYPNKFIKKGKNPVRISGPVIGLQAHGLSKREAHACRKMARVTDEEFKRTAEVQRPPTPLTWYHKNYSIGLDCSTSWQKLRSSDGMFNMLSFCKNNEPIALARGMKPDEARRAREMSQVISEWLDAFEQALPKTPRG